MARHYSPPGTFEAIRKEILEDPTWTPAAFRLALYLTTKPDGWVLHHKHIADGTGLKPSTVEAGIRELRRRGLVYDEQVRTEGSRRIDRWEARFRRDLIVTPTSTPTKKRGVGATSADTSLSTPPKNGGVEPLAGRKPQVTPTPPKNEGVDPTPAKNREVEGLAQSRRSQAQPGTSPQVSQPPDFSLPLQKIAPNREDGLKELKDLSEDGLVEKTKALAARTDHAQPAPEVKTGSGEQAGVVVASLADSNQDGLGTPETAQTVLKKFIDWDRANGGQLTRRTISQLAKHITDLLSQGIDEKIIRRGLADWRGAGQNPVTLDSFVNAVMKGRAQRTRPAGVNGRQPSARHPSYEDLQNDWKD